MDFRKKYLLAIVLTTLLIITNQVIIQYFLAQKRYDAKIINVSGKQRMLSQRLTGSVHHYYLTKDEQVREEIQQNFEEWENVHYSLINGSQQLKIKKLPSDIALKLEEITSKVVYAKKILNNIDDLNISDLEQFKNSQNVFLTKMNKAVKSLEKASDRKLTTIIVTEIILAVLTLFVLCGEILWVFVPAVRQSEQQNKNLQENNKILEQYAYIASHDLRTPVTNIAGFLRLLEKKVRHKLNNNELKYLDFIREEIERMDETTKDLMTYAIANNVKKDKVDFKQVVEEVIVEWVNEENNDITVGKLPENLVADKNLMKLLFKNLISNAVKFMPKDRQPQIEIFSEKQKGTYVFKIKDNGIGIPDADKQKIFGIFKRLHTRKAYNGTGIGLALCRRIVEGHQGRIWVQSTEGTGSTFCFTIPTNHF